MIKEEIKTVEELVEAMNVEAERWGRTEAENATVNGAGVKQQWQGIIGRDEDEFPLPVHALMEDPTPVARPDGTMAEHHFQMYAFWFNFNGERVERPNLVIDND